MGKSKKPQPVEAETTAVAPVTKKAEIPAKLAVILKARNNTPYFKVDPDSGVRFNAYEVCEIARITGWLESQIAAKLFEIVE